MSLLTARSYTRGKVIIYALGNQELSIFRPTVKTLDETDLFVAQRLAMSSGRVLFVGRAVSDVAVKNDQRGPVLRLPENLESAFNPSQIIGVADSQHVPAISKKSACHILRERDARVPFYGDVVVVVNPA